MTHYITCRAKVTDGCLDGKATVHQFGEDIDQDEDGTFLDGTIICDYCYMRLMPLTASGRGLHHELPDAIERARAQR